MPTLTLLRGQRRPCLLAILEGRGPPVCDDLPAPGRGTRGCRAAGCASQRSGSCCQVVQSLRVVCLQHNRSARNQTLCADHLLPPVSPKVRISLRPSSWYRNTSNRPQIRSNYQDFLLLQTIEMCCSGLGIAFLVIRGDLHVCTTGDRIQMLE